MAISLGGRLTPTLQRLVDGSRCRVVVVPNAVEMPSGSIPYPQARIPVRLLFVGRFAFNKGLDVLLAVARRLEKEGRTGDVRFVLAGDGPLLEGMKQEGLPANVELPGRVDDAQLSKLYAECHALLLPTRFEGMPTVVLEAMAHARPVIVSDVGATAELVDERNGYLLPKGDADALHKAVLDFTQRDTTDRAFLGSTSRDRVLDGFTWPKVTDRFLAVFRSLAER